MFYLATRWGKIFLPSADQSLDSDLPSQGGVILGNETLQLRRFGGGLTAEGCLPAAHSTAEKINPSDLKWNLESSSQHLLQKQTLNNLFIGMYWKDIVFTESAGRLGSQAQKKDTRAEQPDKHVQVTPPEQSELLQIPQPFQHPTDSQACCCHIE